MIYDMSAFLGPYDRRPVGVDAEGLARLLGPCEIERVFAGRIDTLRHENGHLADFPHSSRRIGRVTVETVPVIDPSIPTWPEQGDAHFEANGHSLPMVRLHPGHHGYAVDDMELLGPLVEWSHHRGIVIQVVLALDDARRRHQADTVRDVPLNALAKLAKRYPQQRFLASGATFPAVAGLAQDKPGNLWVDTARLEAADGLARLLAQGWGDRLVFASFAPILIVHSAMARVLVDLNDQQARKIFRENAERLLSADRP